MLFQVKVRVDRSKLTEFARVLQAGGLDRSCIQGDTHCLRSDPEVGFSIWKADSRSEFDGKFAPWRAYYTDVEINDVITPMEAMSVLFRKS
jgi:hypothetical protein